MLPQQYCLRWRYHHSNLQTMFSQLLERQAYCDVTLACEGRTIKAHKIVLSACSTFFDNILSQYEEKDPILIMKDVKYIDIKCLVEFMYKGEINVDHCHLATLLKTAEDLKIKGLAEVSWNDDEGGAATSSSETSTPQSNGAGIHAALQHVAAVIEPPKTTDAVGNKRKRGRPPIDDYDYAQQQQQQLHHHHVPAKMPASSVGAASDAGSNDDALSPENLTGWDDEGGGGANGEDDGPGAESFPTVHPQMKVKADYRIKMEYQSHDDSDSGATTDQHQPDAMSLVQRLESIPANHYMNVSSTSLQANAATSLKASSSNGGGSAVTNATGSGSSSSTSSLLTAALEKEWPDVIKMNDYLNTGRRQQFWEEPFTKRVMDAIKHKNLEMKIAAELLGVSYGTLYGRYRDAYGCLKHPYRIKEFWTEHGPTDVLAKLKRKEITLFRAAEQLNVTPQTLSNYLVSMAVLDNEPTPGGNASTSTATNAGGSIGGGGGGGSSSDHQYDDIDWEDDGDMITPDALYQQLTSAAAAAAAAVTTATTTSSVLANCPDITIIKKEKYDPNRMNNNADHSDATH